MEIEVAAARRPVVPPGYRFTPTPEELIQFYLNPWVTGQHFFPGVVIAADIYALDPDALTSRFAHARHDGNWYFLCVARWKGGKAGTRMNRCVSGSGGTWHGSSKRKPVGKDGHRQGFEYRAAGDRKTPWIMEEFVTNLKEVTDGEGVRVICKVHRSPRAAPPLPDNGEETTNNKVGSSKKQLHGENDVDQCYYATTTSEAAQGTEEETSNKVGCGSKKRPKQLHEENNVECYYATTFTESGQAVAEEESYVLAGSKRPRLHGEQQHGLAACTVTVAPPAAEVRYYCSYTGKSQGAAAAFSTATTLQQQSVMEQDVGFFYPNSVNGRVGIGDGEPEQSPVEIAGMEAKGLSQMDYSFFMTAEGMDVNEWLVKEILRPDKPTDGVEDGDDPRAYAAETSAGV